LESNSGKVKLSFGVRCEAMNPETSCRPKRRREIVGGQNDRSTASLKLQRLCNHRWVAFVPPQWEFRSEGTNRAFRRGNEGLSLQVLRSDRKSWRSFIRGSGLSTHRTMQTTPFFAMVTSIRACPFSKSPSAQVICFRRFAVLDKTLLIEKSGYLGNTAGVCRLFLVPPYDGRWNPVLQKKWIPRL